jgi:hypothetical protein
MMCNVNTFGVPLLGSDAERGPPRRVPLKTTPEDESYPEMPVAGYL